MSVTIRRPRPGRDSVWSSARRHRGDALAELVLDSHSWVHRRIDRLDLEPSGACRRHVSVDLTPPAAQVIPGSVGRICIPLGLAAKGPLRGFSIFSDEGPLPMLETTANGELALDLLLSLARRTFGSTMAMRPDFESACRKAIYVDSPARPDTDGEEALADLARLTETLGDGISPFGQLSFVEFAARLSHNFLMVVEVPAALTGTRIIVKYTYLEETLSALNRRHPRINCVIADFGFAPSVHFEFTPPTLLTLTNVTMLRGLPGTDQRPESVAVDESALLHFATRPRNRLEEANIELQLAARREGVVATAFFAVLVTAGVLLAAAVLRLLRGSLLGSAPVAASSAGALLALGSGLLTWVARSPEDRVVSQVLSRSRRVLWCSALLAAAAAGLLAVPVVEPARTVFWWMLAIGQLTVAVFAVRIRVDSRSAVVPSEGPDQEGRP